MKRITALLLSIGIVLTLFAGCGASGASGGGEAAEPAASGDGTSQNAGGSQASAEPGASLVDQYDWDAETETDKLWHEDVDAKLGELTPDMVPDGLRIGVVSMELANEYWIDLSSGIEARCAELGIDVDIQYVNGPNDFEGTLAAAETLAGLDYDAYIFSPENETVLEDITRQLVESGKPVVNAYCCTLTTASCLVGSLDSKVANAAAQLTIDLVGDEGNVAVAMGAVAAKLAQVRTNYYKDYLSKNSNIVVEDIPAEWDSNVARTMTSDLLAVVPDLQVVWCNNDNLGLGVIEGLREKKALETCKVIAMDGTSAGLQAVKDGDLYATFWNNPVYIGALSVDTAVRLLLGQDVPRIIETDTELVTMENVDRFIK